MAFNPNRVVITDDSGNETDDAGLTYDLDTDYLYVGGRLGIADSSPDYPLDVDGQARVTDQLGVGTTPGAVTAVLASIEGTTNAAHHGVLASAANGYPSQFTQQIYGAYFTAAHDAASQLASNSIGGLRGVYGNVTITADDATVTRGVAGLFRINTTSGSNREFTNAHGIRLDTVLGVGGSVGNYYGVYIYPTVGSGSIDTTYGVYMPTCGGDNRWGVYIADTGAKNYFAGQVQVPAGAVSSLGVAFIGDLDTGWYHPSADVQAWVTSGSERMTMTNSQVTVTFNQNLGVVSVVNQSASEMQSPFASKRMNDTLATGLGPGYAFLIEKPGDQNYRDPIPEIQGGGYYSDYALGAMYCRIADVNSPKYGLFSFVVSPRDQVDGSYNNSAEVLRITHEGAVWARANVTNQSWAAAAKAVKAIYTFSGDTHTGWGQADDGTGAYIKDDTLSAYTGGTERFRIGASAIGIPTGNRLYLDTVTLTGSTYIADSSGSMQFATNAGVAMTITSSRDVGIGTATPGTRLHLVETQGAGSGDKFAAGITLEPLYNGSMNPPRHNYIKLLNPGGTLGVDEACVFKFDAAAGTHKAVDGSSTKSTPGSVNAWMKINVNGTVHYVPAYTSKTS